MIPEPSSLTLAVIAVLGLIGFGCGLRRSKALGARPHTTPSFGAKEPGSVAG